MPKPLEEPAAYAALPTPDWISPEARRLLGTLTLEEKIGQMTLLTLTRDTYPNLLDQARRGRLGAYLCYSLTDIPFAMHVELMEASQQSRAGIPVLHGRDVIHGHLTVFPTGLGLAASFDPQLVESIYETVAAEATDENIFWTFTPMLDIARDPRWGRIVEGFGEDPYLAARLAEAAVWGLQGRHPEDLARPERMLACLKHFIGYGAAEGGRDADTCEISRNTLLNIYFPPFLAAFRAGAGSVMSGYHDLNGEPVSASRDLLAGLVKRHGELQGFIVSDYDTNLQLEKYRFVENLEDAACIAANAGLDMDMASGAFAAHLEKLVGEGRVSEARIDDAVLRILEMKLRLDLWHRFRDAVTDRATFQPPASTLAKAVEATIKSSVLLLNRDDILPLPPETARLYVAGPLASGIGGLYGPWALDPIDRLARPLLEALAEYLPTTEITTIANPLFLEPSLKELTDTIPAPEIVLYVGGEGPDRSGERNNLACIDLPAGQEEQILAYSRIGKKVILVLLAGRPLNLTRLLPHVAAILYVFHPGTAGFEGIAQIIAGRNEPRGRLPVSFPRAQGQIPLFYNSINKRSSRPQHIRYLDVSETPLFPFGAGWGYTKFSVAEPSVVQSVIRSGESALVSALVTNTGARDGETVVQCYLQDCVASRLRPMRELKAFRRVHLAAGQAERITFELGAAELGFFNQDAEWIVEPGRFRVFLGLDSDCTLETEFRLA